jgi:hypothetical protein
MVLCAGQPVPVGPAPLLVEDNPFMSDAPASRNVHFDLPSTPPSVGAESFASPSPSHSELDGEQGHPIPAQQTRGMPVTPTRPSRRINVTPNRQILVNTNITPNHRTSTTLGVITHSRGTPRAGRHSPFRLQHQEQPQINEAKKLKARDVWSFYKHENGQHACLFCKSVIPLILDSLHCYSQSLRQKQAVDSSFVVQTYGSKTGTTVLRTHLCNEHLGPWVDGCDRFKIPIVAKTFQDRVDEYRKANGSSHARQEDPALPTRAYSREAFIDAIVEWIISDDQVRLLIKIYLLCIG